MTLFKIIRILILLAVFVVVAFYAKNQKLKSRSWTEPLSVVIYRINGDNNSPVVNEYINELDAGVFEPVDRFMRQQSEKYKLITRQPTQIQMGPVLTVQPPEAPLPGSGYASIIWWGLKFLAIGLIKTRPIRIQICAVSVFLCFTIPPSKAEACNIH